MEDVRNHQEEHVLPAKRKPDPEFVVEAATEGQDDESSKKAKLENSVDGAVSSAAEDKKIGEGSQNDVCSVKDEEEQDEDDEEDYKFEEEEEEDEDEQSNGEAEIDRKGKAIRSDDKGKGKLVEESVHDSDSDSDSSAFGSDSDTDGESDLSDDPLAEVDLDNILPSRTRRRSVHPGVFISNAAGNPKHDGDSDA
ncbi:PREDICTED: protein bfr2 [Ipomoea nil]|uniref:protein bfr2 n=1 Tax=Ipomoea nil TaxID=35883 RepID=UPI000900902B|nr:PREDICTED: protein bfr2 [Ipomoea nil]